MMRNLSSRRHRLGGCGCLTNVSLLLLLLFAVLGTRTSAKPATTTASRKDWTAFRWIRAGSSSHNNNHTAASAAADDTRIAVDTTTYDDDDDEEEYANSTSTSTMDDPNSMTGAADNKKLDRRKKRIKKRQKFLDRLALISSSLGTSEMHHLDEYSDSSNRLNDITPDTDLSLPHRHIHIVTTAALPWFTGTAVNPLLRAAYLFRRTQSINEKEEYDDDDGQEQQQVQSYVTLVIPWLELPEDQMSLYKRVFDNESEQEEYIRDWLKNEAGMEDAADGLNIRFYPARYHSGLGSIFAMGDIIENLGDDRLDVCVLEEPEHCNWYRAPGDGWTQRFNYVVGIVHTNYREYASAHYSGLWTAPAISLISSAMVRAYCHKVIKLSDTLQSYAVEKETTSNVHGVRSNFWQEGVRRAREQEQKPHEGDHNDQATSTTEVYYVGKLLWAKGLDLLLDLEDYYRQYTGKYFNIDVYGSGPDERAIRRAFHGRRNSVRATPEEEAELEAEDDDEDEIMDDSSDEVAKGFGVRAKQKFVKFKDSSVDATKEKIAKFKDSFNNVELPKSFAELRRKPIPATFPGRVDHGELKDYKVFVNPSISEVLCTTTAEALAMGKFAIIPFHPSNTFFLQFPNCLAYRNKFEFVANLRWALTHDPEPLTEEQSRQFTWEAATDRLIEASAVTWKEALERERKGMTKVDERIAWLHNEIGKGTTGDFLRRVLGAGPVSHQVKYQKQVADQEELSSSDDDELSASSSDDSEDETGFSGKLRRSSFAQAMSAAMEDVAAFSIQ